LALLELEGVSKAFGGVRASAEFSFTVGEGELVGVMGPTDHGRHSLQPLITGALRPDGGRIRMRRPRHRGLSPTASAPRHNAHVSARPPFAGLSRSRTCWSAASMAARASAVQRPAEAERLLALVGLGGRGHLPAVSLKLMDRSASSCARASRPRAPPAARRADGRPQPRRDGRCDGAVAAAPAGRRDDPHGRAHRLGRFRSLAPGDRAERGREDRRRAARDAVATDPTSWRSISARRGGRAACLRSRRSRPPTGRSSPSPAVTCGSARRDRRAPRPERAGKTTLIRCVTGLLVRAPGASVSRRGLVGLLPHAIVERGSRVPEGRRLFGG